MVSLGTVPTLFLSVAGDAWDFVLVHLSNGLMRTAVPLLDLEGLSKPSWASLACERRERPPVIGVDGVDIAILEGGVVGICLLLIWGGSGLDILLSGVSASHVFSGSGVFSVPPNLEPREFPRCSAFGNSRRGLMEARVRGWTSGILVSSRRSGRDANRP